MRLKITMIYSSCEKEAKKIQFQTGSYALHWNRVANARPTDRTNMIGVHYGNIARPKLKNRILSWTCSTLNITVSNRRSIHECLHFNCISSGFNDFFHCCDLCWFCIVAIKLTHRCHCFYRTIVQNAHIICGSLFGTSFMKMIISCKDILQSLILKANCETKWDVKCDKNSIKQ